MPKVIQNGRTNPIKKRSIQNAIPKIKRNIIMTKVFIFYYFCTINWVKLKIYNHITIKNGV
jgi:hypothetical protein